MFISEPSSLPLSVQQTHTPPKAVGLILGCKLESNGEHSNGDDTESSLLPPATKLEPLWWIQASAIFEAPQVIPITPRYTDDTTLMAESKEQLKSLLMNVKEERVKKLA